MIEQPTMLEIGNINVTSLTLSWTKPNEGGGFRRVNQYDVVLVPSDGTNTKTETVNSDFGRVESTISNLTSNTKYSITVAASDMGMVVGAMSTQEAITCKYRKMVRKHSNQEKHMLPLLTFQSSSSALEFLNVSKF